MNPQITEKPAFTVVGIRTQTNPKSDEITQLWTNHGARLGQVSNMVGDGSYGVMEMNERDGILEYMAAVNVSQVGELPDGMSRWDVPVATYAVFDATLPTLGKTFDSIYSEWLPRSEYQRATGPDLEHYGPGFNPHDPNAAVFVYIPVEKRSGRTA